MLNALDPVALEPALRQEKARRSLLDFARLMYPRFDSPPHLRLIADLLERLERREMRKLQISVPVRHGKSVLASQLYIAWLIGRNPEAQIVLASHSEELAIRNSRIARHLLEDDRWPFPNVKLASDSSAAGRWNTKQGGGVYAVGVGGSITGRGATDLCIDDAVHDGLSQAERDKAYRWYSEIMASRVEPGGASIVIGARFAHDDLCGKILDSEDGRNWQVVNLAAIAGDNDILKREPGTALWPDRFPLKELEERRIEMGSRAFEAQFQQRPIPLEGGLFRRDWFNQRYKELPAFIDSSMSRDVNLAPRVTVTALDAASKKGDLTDFSVFLTAMTDGKNIYILDVLRKKMEFPELVITAKRVYREQRPRIMYVEDASNGVALVQQLKAETGINIVPVRADGSKEARANAVTALFESGRILLPERAPWLEAFIDEMCEFPGGKWDDQVDSCVLALRKIVNDWNARFRSANNRAVYGRLMNP